MELCTSIEKMREVRSTLAKSGKPVGLVPTMGALHDGHLQLIREASREAEVVVSIFVNPTQFGPGEDLDRYPRDPQGDLELCKQAGVKAVFMPTVEEMYPKSSSTANRSAHQIGMTVGHLNQQMCGASRPGHFEGVCLVVSKLFHIIQPDLAWFGQKDIQQYVILETMVRELNFPVVMRMVPTVREADGLAMSSRNRYLSPEEREIAPLMHKALYELRIKIEDGFDSRRVSLSELVANQHEQLSQAGFRLDYLGVYCKETLQPISDVDWEKRMRGGSEFEMEMSPAQALYGPLLIAGAGWLGSTRLIDNIVLS